MSSFFSIPRTSQLSFLTVVRARLSANGPSARRPHPVLCLSRLGDLDLFWCGADAPIFGVGENTPDFGVGENTCRFLAWAKTPTHFL